MHISYFLPGTVSGKWLDNFKWRPEEQWGPIPPKNEVLKFFTWAQQAIRFVCNNTLTAWSLVLNSSWVVKTTVQRIHVCLVKTTQRFFEIQYLYTKYEKKFNQLKYHYPKRCFVNIFLPQQSNQDKDMWADGHFTSVTFKHTKPHLACPIPTYHPC